MTPERWKQIKELLGEALGLAPAERHAFVEAQAAGDEELRREVLSLLESYQQAGEFLESPAADLKTITSTAKADANLAGVRLGAYELVREIGRGGMGTVYLAVRVDREFQKHVAIKLIRGGMESEFAIRRFRHERQILARLEHPNIARLLDGGTTDQGFPYFVMEYIEGEPLLAHCQSRALGLRERVELLRTTCGAVEYAHRRLIIHRDLKPGNILVTPDGTPKLLDFGVAKLLDPEATEAGEPTMAGFRLVTPAYASPEQLRGEPATPRSDIYSLGLLLWQLMTGVKPVRRGGECSFDFGEQSTTATEWPLLQSLRNVVRKAARTDPEERYETAAALASDLQRALAGVEIPPGEATQTVAAAQSPPEPGSIAVLPFQLLGTDTTSETYLGVGITDAIITRLSSIGRVAVRTTGAVMNIGANTSALEAGRRLNVQFVLEGRVQKARNRVRVTVQLVELPSEAIVWASSFNEEFEDLLKVEDSISAQVAQALVPQLTGEERERMALSGTRSPKAHEAYSRGRWYWSRHTEDALPKALTLFSEALAEDPQYARAHSGIADYQIALGIRGLVSPAESFAAAVESARAAIDLDPKLAEAHASLGFARWVLDDDYETAAYHLQLAIALNPDYAPAHDWLGLISSSRGRTEMATESIERARKLDPSGTIYGADLALCQYAARRFDLAVRCFAETPPPPGVPAEMRLGEAPAVTNGAILPLSLLGSGNVAQAVETARAYASATDRSALALGVLACAEASAQNLAAAQALADELRTRAKTQYVSGLGLALAALACGQKEEAVREIDRACRERDWWTMWLGRMAVWDKLRGHAQFERLLRDRRASTRDAVQTAEAVAAPPLRKQKPRRRFWWTAAAILAAVLGVVAYYWFRPLPRPFQGVRVSRITTNGIAESAVISPDGALVAYTVRNQGSATVWIRDLRNRSTLQVAGPFESLVPLLEFTRDGKNLAFVTRPVNDPAGGALYFVSAAGGAPQLVLSGLSTPVGVAPDGKHVALYRTEAASGSEQLVVAELKQAGGQISAGRERVVFSRRHPDKFVSQPGPVWSPDGMRIACAMRGPRGVAYGAALFLVSLDGSVQLLHTPAWQNIGGIAWMKHSHALLVVGQHPDDPFQQIWHVPLGRGASTRITNDFTNYNTVSLTADESAMISVQIQSISNLYVTRPGESARPVQITPGAGRYFDVAWTPSGSLVYASDATGSAEIWTMDANGKNLRQLTSGPGRSYGPSVSPDGRTIVFHSNRGGVWNIWKMDASGRNPAQLTHDSSDSTFAKFMPDGAGLVYQHLGDDARQSIWKIPLQGGSPVRLTSTHTMYPAVSSRGLIAVWSSLKPEEPARVIAVYQPGAAEPLRLFGFPINRMPGMFLRWMPQSDAISYIETIDGVSNIWMQPIAGGPPKMLTNFTAGRIYSFDWSRDGRLAYSQGMTTSDVVLMRGADQQ